MRGLILKIHMYGGLFCASYLLILGLSSLNYNHHFGPPTNEKVTWERSLYEAVVAADGQSVRIVESAESLRRTLVGFHRLHGYGGGLLYDVWTLLYDLASLSLIVFAFSGIYMWYKLTTRRSIGWIVLGASFTYAAAIVSYLLYSP